MHASLRQEAHTTTTPKLSWVFTATFIGCGLLACALAIVGAIQHAPQSWIMVIALIAGVVLSSVYQRKLGTDPTAPQAGVAIVFLMVAAPSEDPWFWAGVWALGYTASQLMVRRQALHGLYIAGLGIVSGYATVYLQVRLFEFEIWPVLVLLISVTTYYLLTVIIAGIGLQLTSEKPAFRHHRAIQPKQVITLLGISTGAALLMYYFNSSVVTLLEADDSTNRLPFIVLAAGLIFYILGQRKRFARVETQLSSVLEAAVTLPHLAGNSFLEALTERAATIVHAEAAEVRPNPAGRHEIGATVRLCSGESQNLVATHKISGDHFSHEDTRALNSLAEAASQAAEMRMRVESLELKANTDTLTELPNYGAFQKALTEANAHREYHDGIALLFIDLDNFKKLNDNFGHRTGDQLLQAIAQRLNTAAGGGGFVARVGGDEFVVLLTGLTSLDQAKVTSDRIIQATSKMIRIEGKDFRPVLSAGLAYSRHRELDPQTLVEDADRTMLQEKRARRDAGALEHSSLAIASHRSTRTNEIIARAIRDNRLALAYQPIVNVADGRIWAYEALVRYVDPELGPISPPSLVARAKSLGLMNELTKQIITQALDAAEDFYAIDPSVSCITVNLELGQISEAELGTFITDAAAAHPNISLCIELNESSLHSATIDLRLDAERLQAAGIIIALDDYGSDDSSVRALVHFPMNILKLDKSLISDLTDKRQSELVRALQAFGDTMNFTTVVEGVESAGMVEALQALGVRSAQGYYFGRPAPAMFVCEQLRNAQHTTNADTTLAITSATAQ